MQKLLLNILIVFIALFPLTISISSQKSSADDNILKVGMECAYAPYNWMQSDDQNGAVKIDGIDGYANGYDVQIAKIIADKLGKNLVIVKTEWDGLLPSLQSHKIDLIIAGMTYTPDRAKVITFSEPYYIETYHIVVRNDSKYANAKTLSDFSNAKITSQLGTTLYDYVDQIPKVDKRPAIDDFPTMVTAVESKNIDGYVVSNFGAKSASLQNNDITYITFDNNKGFDVPDTEAAVRVGIRKDDKTLENEVNQALGEISKITRDQLANDALINQDLEASTNDNADDSTIVPNQEDENPQDQSFFSIVKMIFERYTPLLLQGTGVTLLISILGTLIGLVIGTFVAMIRLLPKYPLQKLVNGICLIYINVFRGTPMIVQATIFYYGLAELANIQMSPIFAGAFVISINTGAYLAEVVRGGIKSIGTGQYEAATCIGFKHFKIMRKIILPQAFLNCLPAIGNEFITNIKDSAVLNVISVTELFFITKSIKGATYHTYESFLVAAVIYLVLTLGTAKIFSLIEKRLGNEKEMEISSSSSGII